MRTEDTITVRTYGNRGPSVVVLHGGPGGQGSVASLAVELEKDFRVFEPLQRRHGEVPLTVERHVKDLFKVTPVGSALVGWSWGAMLALSFAARYPGRASSLALIGCGTYDTGSRRAYQKEMERRLGKEGRNALQTLQGRVETRSNPPGPDSLFEEAARVAARAQAFDPIDDGDENLQVDRLGHEETWEDVLRLQREGIEPASFTSIYVPSVMFHGENDPHSGPATYSVLKGCIPHLQYVSFKRCGHRPWLERHARHCFLETLRGWLGGNCL